MKAIAQTQATTPGDITSLVDMDLPKPTPAGHDLLVRVEAISVNPVDTKVRQGRKPEETAPRVLGWDAAGVVEAIGPDVTAYEVGDEVYYAGDITRPGSNSEFHLVDARIVGLKPSALSFAEAAAMPLTTITAWEALFDRLGVDRHNKAHRDRTLLIIGGAGGVGSIAIQLAKMADLTVIATASRPETSEWVRGLGADHVVDHRKPLPAQLTALGYPQVDYIANFSNTDEYWVPMAEMIAPQGHIVSIVENSAPLDLNLLKSKSATFTWEFMFTRSMYQTPDMAKQGELLNEAAAYFESGELRTTLTDTLSPINAENIRLAHTQLASGRTIGKLALFGW